MALTVKQQKFADEYIISGNATQAAITAGYSKKTAYAMGAENLKKPVITEYIKKQCEEVTAKKVISQQEILERLSKFGRGEATETVVTNKGDAIKVPVGAKDQIRSLELLGRRYSMWTDNVNLNGSDIKITIGGDDDDN